MQSPIILSIGLHIEHPTTLTLVQAMLSLRGHHIITDRRSGSSLSAYLETVIEDLYQASSSRYDLLILAAADEASLTDPKTCSRLLDLLGRVSLPTILLTDSHDPAIKAIGQQCARVALLSRSPLVMQQLFQTMSNLTQTPSQIPTSLHRQIQQIREAHYEQLIQQERARAAQRQVWLDQRQEWLEQRNAWLDERQAWIEAKRQLPDPQYEWLAEQQTWLEHEQREVDHQCNKVADLRRWLNRYQSRIDEEQPPPFREVR